MSRMLEALKTLEARKAQSAPSKQATEPVLDPTRRAAPVRPAAIPVNLAEPGMESSLAPLATISPCVACCLPTTLEVSDRYLEMASCIADQAASNYCNVLLFVSPDRASDKCFSMTYLAQAFALQSPGELLLVDGDLHGRRLSKAVGSTGRGLGDVMVGAATWSEVIHPTNMPSIDFVACGKGQVPTVERGGFGWSALRPQYRAVLIGVALAGQPESTWLASRCDGVYLVISRPYTQRQTASAAVNALRSCGANVLGTVVTDD